RGARRPSSLDPEVAWHGAFSGRARLRVDRQRRGGARRRWRRRRPRTTETVVKRKRTRPNEEWILRLYVAGQSARSAAALRNLETICERHLAGRYRIEVIDLLKQPLLARGDQIVA